MAQCNQNRQHLDLRRDEPKQVAVVMVPFPAQGHLNQLLQLSRLIISYNLPVHYVGSINHNRQARLRVHCWDPDAALNIHFHDFAIPCYPCPDPDPNTGNKFPTHLEPSFYASSHLREPVAKLLHSLSLISTRVVVIHDSLMGAVVQDFTCLPNGESYTFHSVSAFTLSLFLWEALGSPAQPNFDVAKEIPSLEGCFTAEFLKFIAGQYEFKKYTYGALYNTSKVIEGPYLDLLAKQSFGHVVSKHWAIGPLNPLKIPQKNTPVGRHFCLEWLDKQEPNSVIYVSFGTTTCMEDEQIKELAIGIEKSKQSFIWVLRDADKGDVFNGEGRRAELPKGFEERVKGRGLVVREWAPQLEILNHKSTGGFMSHCGWNSCMESISMGVPIAAWPMHSDQPRNTVLITDLLKVGLAVREWKQRQELVTSKGVEGAVKMLMASREGDDMRKRAAELSEALQEATLEGGCSRQELDSFISHITR